MRDYDFSRPFFPRGVAPYRYGPEMPLRNTQSTNFTRLNNRKGSPRDRKAVNRTCNTRRNFWNEEDFHVAEMTADEWLGIDSSPRQQNSSGDLLESPPPYLEEDDSLGFGSDIAVDDLIITPEKESFQPPASVETSTLGITSRSEKFLRTTSHCVSSKTPGPLKKNMKPMRKKSNRNSLTQRDHLLERLEIEDERSRQSPPQASISFSTQRPSAIPRGISRDQERFSSGQGEATSKRSKRMGSGWTVGSNVGHYQLRQVPPKSPIGLANLGNSCFINSLIQALMVVPQIQRVRRLALEAGELQENDNSTVGRAVFSAMFDMERGMKERNDIAQEYTKNGVHPQSMPREMTELDGGVFSMKPHKLVNTIRQGIAGMSGEDDGNYNIQCDVQEVMNAVFTEWTTQLGNEMLSENQRENGQPNVFTKMFEAVLKRNLKCLCCQRERALREPAHILTVPVPSRKEPNMTIEECISRWCRAEIVEANCGECMVGQFKESTIQLSKLPDVVCILSNLFKYNRDTGRIKKVMKQVASNEYISLNDVAAEGCANRDETYWLRAVIMHHGDSIQGGHYTCYVRDTEKFQWYNCNDEVISEVSDAEFSRRVLSPIDRVHAVPYVYIFSKVMDME